MHKNRYIYSFSYCTTESELCKVESRYIFNEEEKGKLLVSDVKVGPPSSAFIKSRLEVISFSRNYKALIEEIKNEKIRMDEFKVEYLVFDGDLTEYAIRLEKLKDIGYSIDGMPDYYNPKTTYGLCCHEGIWCFGVLIKNHFDWFKHKEKPHSYSNSINPYIAKALVNIAAKANRERTILDACCGVGTIMLEACFSGFNIEGSDINWKVCRNARENLAHFNYDVPVYRSDIKDINKRFDAAIIDLPYNLLSCASDDDILHIIQSSAEITNRLVIVSISDISSVIKGTGFIVTDHCSVSKKGKTKFARRIWVCDKIV